MPPRASCVGPDPFIVLLALWLFLPAYVANMAPVLAMKVLPRWNAPIDGGRIWKDGKPLFGKGKTWRGLAAGVLLGALTCVVQAAIDDAGSPFVDFGLADGGWAVPVAFGAFLGLGAIVGDTVKSFFKRRTGREGGAPWVPFDQLDFVVGGLLSVGLAAWLIGPLLGYNWFVESFVAGDRWIALIVLLVLTPGLHFLVNLLGYKLKLKQVPL